MGGGAIDDLPERKWLFPPFVIHLPEGYLGRYLELNHCQRRFVDFNHTTIALQRNVVLPITPAENRLKVPIRAL
jgi:hypothetical protein